MRRGEYGEKLRVMRNEKREKIADDMLDFNYVFAQALKRAALGHTGMIIDPVLMPVPGKTKPQKWLAPVDLEHTEAAKKLEEWLKIESINYQWEGKIWAVEDRENQYNEPIRYKVLKLWW